MKKRRSIPSLPLERDEYFLDEFNRADLRSWKTLSGKIETFNVRLFYHLESLRDIFNEELLNALQSHSKPKEVGKSWFRLVDYKYSNELLSTRGSLIKGGRFNIGNDLNSRKFPPFPALYMAKDYNTAYAEYYGVSRFASGGLSGQDIALEAMKSFAAVKLSFELVDIFDLSKVSNLNAFTNIISKFELPDDLKRLGKSIKLKRPWLTRNSERLRDSLLASGWRYPPMQFEIPSSSQIFGRLLRNAGMEGVKYPSTKGSGKCIAIFTENLDGSDSFVELEDEAPTSVTHTRLHSGNWKQLSSLE